MLGIVNASPNSKTAKSAAGSAILHVPAGKANSHPGPYQTIIRAVLAATIFTEIPDPPPETDLTDLNNSNVAGAAAALRAAHLLTDSSSKFELHSEAR